MNRLLTIVLSLMMLSPAWAALHSSGGWMRDDQNRVVMLHGVNVVWKSSPYVAPNALNGFTAQDADWLKAHGFNSVRLGVLFAGVMPQRGSINSSYLNQVDRIVQLLAERGIYSLLDFHQDLYNEKYKGEGFPSWAVYDYGIPSFYNPGFPAGYLTWNVETAYHNFWYNTNNVWMYYQQALMAVAQKWANQPYLAGYDVINEPAPGYEYVSCFLAQGCSDFDHILQNFETNMQAGIRRVDQKHIIWVEPNILFDFGIPSYLNQSSNWQDKNNIGFSWHNYCLTQSAANTLGFPAPASCMDPESAAFSHARSTQSRLQSASFMTEFGSSDDLGDISRVTQLADQNLSSWNYWAYKTFNDPTGSGQTESMFSNDQDTGSVKTGKLALLERAYPQATAGTPISLSFDPASGNFSYSYTAEPASGPTVIYVPSLHYPNGYSVSVQGAQVISAPNSSNLMLQNNGTGQTVQVHIWAR